METGFKHVVDEARRETIRARNEGYDPGRPRFDTEWILRIAGAVHAAVDEMKTRLDNIEALLDKATKPSAPTK